MRYPKLSALLIFITFLWGCSERVPPGFEAVEPVHIDTSRRGCPDLTGTFELTAKDMQHPGIADWLGPQDAQKRHLIFDEMTSSVGQIYRVQSDLTEFLTQAEQLRKNNPADYYDWRKPTLELLQNTTRISPPKKIESIKKIGPVLQTTGQLNAYACSAGWIKVAEKDLVDSEGRYTRQMGLWIAHDADGNLLLRTSVYRQEPGWTFWAAGGAGVRLIKEYSHWHKIPKMSHSADALVVHDQDLPPVPPPIRSPDCVRNVNELVEYNQRLLQQLPEGVMLTQFLPIQGAPTDPCNRQVLQVGFTGGPRGASDEVLRQLKDDTRVENLVLKETLVSGTGKMKFSVEYTLILN